MSNTDPMRAFVEQVARFTTYSAGSTDDFQDAMDTCNRLIVDARKLLGLPEDDDNEDWSCSSCGETLQDGSGTCITCGVEDEPCTQHRDTGRGVCADCGNAIPGSNGQ